MKPAIITVLLSSIFSLFGSETPDQLRDRGFEALKAAQSDESKIVEAARLLAQAAEAYEKAGKDDLAAELNSYLYWCKKRMTLAQTEAFSRTGDSSRKIVERLSAVAAQAVQKDDAGKWLEKADAFAASHPRESLLCAIRYFEVADRFIGSQESLIAQRKSLDLIGKSRKEAFASFSPVGDWTFLRVKDGKTYTQTFQLDGKFSIENYPTEKYSKGTWRVGDGVVVQIVNEKESSTLTIQDDNTMTCGPVTYRRALRQVKQK